MNVYKTLNNSDWSEKYLKNFKKPEIFWITVIFEDIFWDFGSKFYYPIFSWKFVHIRKKHALPEFGWPKLQHQSLPVKSRKKKNFNDKTTYFFSLTDTQLCGLFVPLKFSRSNSFAPDLSKNSLLQAFARPELVEIRNWKFNLK